MITNFDPPYIRALWLLAHSWTLKMSPASRSVPRCIAFFHCYGQRQCVQPYGIVRAKSARYFCVDIKRFNLVIKLYLQTSLSSLPYYLTTVPPARPSLGITLDASMQTTQSCSQKSAVALCVRTFRSLSERRDVWSWYFLVFRDPFSFLSLR